MTFDKQLTVIGAHLKLATLPFIDLNGFVDYAWTSKDIGSQAKFKLHDLSIGISAKKLFGVTMLKPYVGAGGAKNFKTNQWYPYFENLDIRYMYTSWRFLNRVASAGMPVKRNPFMFQR